jgi:hypothetical protein
LGECVKCSQEHGCDCEKTKNARRSCGFVNHLAAGTRCYNCRRIRRNYKYKNADWKKDLYFSVPDLSIVRFGSLAAPHHRISLMAANGGKADVKNVGNTRF